MGPDALLFDTFRVSFVSYQGFSAIIGPFDKNPFPGHFKISPLNTVSKKDTLERRVILDLSFPAGNSVNDFISKDNY